MKKTFVLAIVSIFLTTSAYAVDCSDYKTFSHKWNMCKLGNLDKLGDDSPNKPEKKGKIGNFFQKIKNFGGENIGEPG
tara:strand:+ start:564 stop:797 length:234 start_codon:yes stop_codon:yes gene_type:complete